MWATAQYLSYAKPGSVVDVDVTIAVSGRNSTQARAVGHVADREIFTVNAALGAREPRHRRDLRRAARRARAPRTATPGRCASRARSRS